MDLPDEVFEFAERVALVDRGDFEQFVKIAVARGRTPEDVAHVLNAYVNQWIRKAATPTNPVGALIALLEPSKRDRLNSGSWTIKKWVKGKRADMLKAAEAERKKQLAKLIADGAAKFLSRTPEERSTLLGKALTWYRENNPDSAILSSIQQAVMDAGRRYPPKEIIGMTSSGYGLFIAEELENGRCIQREKLSE